MALITQSFWESFFESERSEWYFPLSIVREHILTLLETKISPTILHGGCGTALLDHSISKLCFCIEFDFSRNALLKALASTPDEAYRCRNLMAADALRMPFKDGCCDLIIEKGLFDSITSRDSMSSVRAHDVICEFYRLVADDGAVLIFSLFGSDSDEKDMLGLLCHDGFSVECRCLFISPVEIPSQQFCFLYILTKRPLPVFKS